MPDAGACCSMGDTPAAGEAAGLKPLKRLIEPPFTVKNCRLKYHDTKGNQKVRNLVWHCIYGWKIRVENKCVSYTFEEYKRGPRQRICFYLSDPFCEKASRMLVVIRAPSIGCNDSSQRKNPTLGGV